MNAKALKTVFYKHKDYLLTLVKKDELLDSANKRLLTESLLYFIVLASEENREHKLKAIEELKAFQDEFYTTLDPITIGNFGELSARNGNYYFKFTDRDTAINMNVTRVTVKNWGFRWMSFYSAFVKKESNLPFNIDYFIKDIESMAKNSGEWKPK